MLLPFMELSSFSIQQWNEPIKWSHFMSLAPFSLRVRASVLRVTPSALPPLIRLPIALKRVSRSSPLLSCLATVAFPVPPKGGKPSTPALAFRILEQTSVSRISPYLHVVHVSLSAGWKRISSISEGSDFIIQNKEQECEGTVSTAGWPPGRPGRADLELWASSREPTPFVGY